MSSVRNPLPLLAAVVAAACSSLSAQSIWVGQAEGGAVSLEILKPKFEGDDETSLLTSVLFGSLRLPVGNTIVVVGEIPFTHFGVQDSDASEDAIGNPYIGLEIHAPGSSVFGEIGVRAPLADEEKLGAYLLGSITDIHRWEAFIPNYVPVSAAINYRHRAPTGLVMRLRAGPDLWIPEQEEGDPEVLASYSAQVGYEAPRISVLGGLTGKAALTMGGDNFGEVTNHQAAAIVTFPLGYVRPGLFLQVPLDEDQRDAIDFVFGVNVSIELPSMN